METQLSENVLLIFRNKGVMQIILIAQTMKMIVMKNSKD
jgi:hypothetical protein